MIGDLTFECLDCKQPLFICAHCSGLFHASELRSCLDGSEFCFNCYENSPVPKRSNVLPFPKRERLARIMAVR